MTDYRAQLLAVEAKLAKDPTNEDLLQLKSDLEELIELSGSLEEEEQKTIANDSNLQPQSSSASSSKTGDHGQKMSAGAHYNLVTEQNNDNKDSHNKRPLSEAELLARKREKNRKKKAKLREKIKEQLDTAESEKQTWQSFASKKGLKGITKKSIFASPCSVTGKVGVGTNGIADAPSVGATSTITTMTKRKY